MKMSLRVCAKSTNEIRKILFELSQMDFDSNCNMPIENGEVDYEFVDSNDVFSNDDDKPLIDPECRW